MLLLSSTVRQRRTVQQIPPCRTLSDLSLSLSLSLALSLAIYLCIRPPIISIHPFIRASVSLSLSLVMYIYNYTMFIYLFIHVYLSPSPPLSLRVFVHESSCFSHPLHQHTLTRSVERKQFQNTSLLAEVQRSSQPHIHQAVVLNGLCMNDFGPLYATMAATKRKSIDKSN